ncbi:MAG: VOC family protein [Actinomycetota bacterium]
MAHSFQVTFDSKDPATHADFWANALGYIVQPPPPGFDTWEDLARELGIPEDESGDIAAIIDPDGSGPRMLFLRVPEPKTAKNRMHLDINIADRDATEVERRIQVDTEVERLAQLGARKVSSFDEPKGVWTVMLDPEGNEFCVH